MSKPTRRGSSVATIIAQKRASISAPVNLQCLVRVFLLDGSSKVLQMFERSTVKDVLTALKFNLDLTDISCFALFRVGQESMDIRRLDVAEVVADVIASSEVRLLFKSWIVYKYGAYDTEVFQYGKRTKQPSAALWLAFMEVDPHSLPVPDEPSAHLIQQATFVCMTGAYYLSEDESLLLGCLKMQAESGDFNPEVHTVDAVKARVANRFPNPIRSRLKALSSPTLAGSNLAVDVAVRAQTLYARLAGKSRAEAQIDFLNQLRTWCPFYGASQFHVQCQYDEAPMDAASKPPTLPMEAFIGARAIVLSAAADPPVFLRHAYSRILRWVAHTDKNIFTYWVLKPTCNMPEEDEGIDPQTLCDCVYLVSAQVNDIQHLVSSYIQAALDVPPCLPGAREDLLPPPAAAVQSSQQIAAAAQDAESESTPPAPAASPVAAVKSSRFARLGSFFSASGNGLASSAAVKADQQQGFGDDTATVGNSVFKSAFALPNTNESAAPPSFVAKVSELQRMADAAHFSDSEEGSEGDKNKEGSEGESGEDHSESDGTGSEPGQGSEEEGERGGGIASLLSAGSRAIRRHTLGARSAAKVVS